jgi:hypothetical protein
MQKSPGDRASLVIFPKSENQVAINQIHKYKGFKVTAYEYII